jgi:multiple sugar transport system substrate-binding protein
MKKASIVLWGILFIMGFFVGCNRSSGQSSVSQASSADPVEIVYLHWTKTQEIQPIIDAFNNSQKEIHVSYSEMPSGGDNVLKMTTMLMSGDQYDVFGQSQTEHLYQRVKNGLVYPLDDLLVKGGYDYEKLFSKSIRETETFDGKIYGVPYALNRYEILYNKSIFDKAGVPYPTDDWTWDELREIAKKVSSGEGANKIYGWGEAQIASPDWTLMASLELGIDALYKSATESNWDHPVFLRALEFTNNLIKDGSMMPLPEIQIRQMGLNGGRYQSFMKGQTAMHIFPSFIIFQSNYPENKKDFEVGVVNIPKLTKNSPHATVVDHSGMSISSGTKNPEAALEWIMYYCVERPDLAAAAKGMLPPVALTGSYASAEMEEICNRNIFTAPGLNYDEAVFVYTRTDEIINPSVWFTTYNIALNEIKTIGNEESTKVFLGEQDPRTAITNMKRRSDDQIARTRR